MKRKERTRSISRRQFLHHSTVIAVGLSVSAYAKGARVSEKSNIQLYPVRLGVDVSSRDLVSENENKMFGVLEELRMNHLDIYFGPVTNSGSRNAILIGERIAEIDRYMKQHGMTYTLNIEAPNFRESAEITPGINEFDHPGGLHRWDLRMEWLHPVLSPPATPPPAFQGVVYDECEHMQLSNNKFANQRSGGQEANFDKPFLVNTHGLEIEMAYDQLVNAGRTLREEHYEGRVPLYTEQVWPDLFHIFAHAGWTITPKLLKESLSSVVMSIALGAAIQYPDRTHLWVSPDLWRFEEPLGHSAEELRSALLMAYWLGAETIYVESLSPRLVTGARSTDTGPYELTAHGQVFRDFAGEYIPNHPREITWKDYRPRVAIIRLPDGGWGQSPPDKEWEEYPSRNRLLGNREHPLDKAASEWLYVWPVLTHQVVRPGAISLWNKWSYPEKMDFFIPIDSVAVFDHLVEGPVLDSVECFIVCGHSLSSKTFAALRERVDEGATCIIAKRLYDRHTGEQLAGNWLVVKSFLDPAVNRTLQPFLGPSDVARFRFANHMVEFKKGSETDQIEVNII